MDPWGERLLERGVAVVPDGDEAELRGRGVDDGTRPDEDQTGTRRGGQERAVARGGRLVGVEPDDALGADGRRQRRLEPIEVVVVRDGEDGGATGIEDGGRVFGERP